MTEQFLNKVHNYTKYKVVELLVNRYKKDKLKLDNLNAMEDFADDIIEVLGIVGEEFYYSRKR